MSNYNQIIDGIQDQIDELLILKATYAAEIAEVQGKLDRIPGEIASLEALLSTASDIAVAQTGVQPVIRNQATVVSR